MAGPPSWLLPEIHHHIAQYTDLTDILNYRLLSRKVQPHINNPQLENAIEMIDIQDIANIILDHNIYKMTRLQFFVENLLIPIGRNITSGWTFGLKHGIVPRLFPFRLEVTDFHNGVYYLTVNYKYIKYTERHLLSTILEHITDELHFYLFNPIDSYPYGNKPYTYIRVKHLFKLCNLLNNILPEAQKQQIIKLDEFILTPQPRLVTGTTEDRHYALSSQLDNFYFDDPLIVDLYLFDSLVHLPEFKMHYIEEGLSSVILQY